MIIAHQRRLTCSGKHVHVSLQYGPSSTVHSPVWEINPQPQDTTERWISDCGNPSDRVYLQVYLQVLHYLQTTKETGFASLLLYLTTLLRKWKRRREEKWNILQVVFTCRSPHILRKKKKEDFLFSACFKVSELKDFQSEGQTGQARWATLLFRPHLCL